MDFVFETVLKEITPHLSVSEMNHEVFIACSDCGIKASIHLKNDNADKSGLFLCTACVLSGKYWKYGWNTLKRAKKKKYVSKQRRNTVQNR